MMYTVVEAAAVLGVGRSTAYLLIARGDLQAIHLGGRHLVRPSALEKITGSQPPPPADVAQTLEHTTNE